MIVLTALVVTMVLGALLVAVADLLVESSEATRANTAAYLGAQSGADSVDTSQFPSGVTSSGQLRLGDQKPVRQTTQTTDQHGGKHG